MEKTCIGPNCLRPQKVKQLCNAHDLQMRRTGKLKPVRVPKTRCEHKGCDRKHHAGGFCGTHYRHFCDYGETFDIGHLYHQAKGGHETIEQFFWARVRKTDSCREWAGSKTGTRLIYGWVTRYGHEQTAHRLSYKLFKKPVPKGMQVDHVCHNTVCVNPEHLRLASPSQNAQNRKGVRSDSTTGIRGVSPNGRRYEAGVYINKKYVYLGTFDTPEEAGEVAKAARLRHYTHNDKDRG